MPRARTPLLWSCVFSALCATSLGCDPDPGDEAAPSDRLFTIGGQHGGGGGGSLGYRMNTNNAGGHFFSELDLSRAWHEDTRLVEVMYDDPCDPHACPPPVRVRISSIQVVGGELFAELEDGRAIVHSEFGHTRWKIETDEYNPTTYELTVDASEDPGSGVPTYTFYWDDGQGEDPRSTCLVPGEVEELTAVVYADLDVDEFSGTMHHAPGLLTVGCTAGAVGKAAFWHYGFEALKAMYGPDVGLVRFEAAVRMIRADYCGDGVSWTQPGTPVIVEDNLGINAPITGFWPLGQPAPADEAVWDENGATCLETPRASGSGPIAVSCAGGTVVWRCMSGTAAAFANPTALFRTSTPP